MKKLLFILVVLVLSAAAFAEYGAIVGYMQSHRAFPTDAQLNKLTHVILFQIYPNADGSGLVLDWWTKSDANVKTFVDKAHASGKKVIVGIGGSGGKTENFPGATDSETKRTNFANAVKNFVNKHNLDGADLDWEPKNANAQQWRNWLDFAIALKTAMPDKRISGTLGADSPNSQYGNHITKDPTVLAYFKQNIWKIDAVQLMTYDMGGASGWNSTADANASATCLNNWAAFGAGQQGFSKEKIFVGIHMNQDNDASARQKADHARRNGFGGAILWEISDNILNPAYEATTAAGGHVGGGNPPAAVNHTVTVTHNGNGTVKNGNTTINSGGTVPVQNNGSVTLTFTANSGYIIGDVKINGTSNQQAISSGSYTFSNVTSNQTIQVVFSAQGINPPNPPIPPAGDAPDLADGSWGDDAWSKVSDEGRNGSSVNITKQGNPLTANWKLGAEPQGDDIPDDDWPYASIGFYDGDWSNVSKITVNYSVNQPAYIALSSKNGHEYYVELETGNNRSKEIIPSQFQKFDWDGGTHSLVLSQVEGIVIAAYDTYGQTTNLTVTSLKVQGLVIEGEPTNPGTPISRNKTKVITGASANVINGNLNLSLPSSASNANIVLFDARGRILFERSVAMSGNFVSVALPKDILRNQAAVLQVKTNSGVGLTKRILVK